MSTLMSKIRGRVSILAATSLGERKQAPPILLMGKPLPGLAGAGEGLAGKALGGGLMGFKPLS